MTSRRTKPNQRQGLILLVVLGMLTLFTLLGVSYLLLSSSSYKSGVIIERTQQRHTPPDLLLDATVKQVVRGTTDQHSALIGQSLLEDVYNTNSFPVSARPRGLFSGAVEDVDIFGPGYVRIPLNSTGLSHFDHAYNGRLITFLQGPLAGRTYRILNYIGERFTNAAGIPEVDTDLPARFSIFISLSDEASGAKTFSNRGLSEYLATEVLDAPIHYRRLAYADDGTPYQFRINGAAFDGLGGAIETNLLNPQYLNQSQDVYLYADSSNPTQADPTSPRLPLALFHQVGDSIAATSARQGTNEAFDVPDYHDQFLAWSAPSGGNNAIIPSYHRPDVIQHITSYYCDPTQANPVNAFSSLTELQLLRFLTVIDYACARPLSILITDGSSGPLYTADAPYAGVAKSRNIRFQGGVSNSSGANPQLHIDLSLWRNNTGNERVKLANYLTWLIQGPWDIDSDGNTVPDTVIVDPNLPIVTADDGKLLKVLAGISIEDLDGKLDVNRVSELPMADTSGYFPGLNNPESRVTNAAGAFSTIWPTTFDAMRAIPRGFGHGPAETSLMPALGGDAGKLTLLLGGRYGSDGFPGFSGDDYASTFRQRETRALHQHALVTGLSGTQRSGKAMGIDLNGTPRLSNNTVGGLIPSDTIDDAYEISKSDSMYTLEDLERVVRRFDKDRAELPSRLQDRLGLPAMSAVNRLITTRSAELRNVPIALAGAPVFSKDASATAPSPVLAAGNLLGWIRMVHEQRYRINKPTSNGSFDPAIHDPQLISEWANLTPANRRAQLIEFQVLRELFPMEFRQGLRMNVNRAFGDGINNDFDPDSNGLADDNQVDEPEELENYPQNESYTPPGYGANSVIGTYDGTSSFAGFPTRLASRQLYARNLYCLAQLIIPRECDDIPGLPSTVTHSNPNYERLRARILAQWAVNVVDFRDTDAAMTRFEFDQAPFGRRGVPGKAPGWEPQPGNVVWGVELPDVLLTESLTFHDKRVKDTSEDDVTHRQFGSMPGDDSNTDQYRLPQGSLFFEIYNWRTTGDQTSQEIMGVPVAGISADHKLYTPNGARTALRLNALAPNSGNAYGTQPVWRIGISARLPAGSPLHPNVHLADPDQRLVNTNQINLKPVGIGPLQANDRDSGLSSNLLAPAAPSPKFDRIVWFSNLNPDVPAGTDIRVPDLVDEGGVNSQHRVFYYRAAGDLLLEGGSYLVVGPRPVTHVGSQNSTVSPPRFRPSPQRIDLSTFGVYHLDDTVATLPASAATKSTLTAVVAANPPAAPGWNAVFPDGVGLNATEPVPIAASYYSPVPTRRINSTAGSGFDTLPPDSWHDYADSTVPPIASNRLPNDPFDLSNPELQDMYSTGTYLNYRFAYLQRLADPEIAFDPVLNPYITVDWIGLDATVFNGEDTVAHDHDDTPIKIAFQSRYKNGVLVTEASDAATIARLTAPVTTVLAKTDVLIPTSKGMSFFSPVTAPFYETTALTTAPPPMQDPPYFRHQLGYIDGTYLYGSTTLGFLNMGQCVKDTLPITSLTEFDAFGPPTDNLANNTYDGGPAITPIAPLVFNRPFASPYELSLVPRTSMSTLGFSLSRRDTASGNYGQLFSPTRSNTLVTAAATPEGYWLKSSTADFGDMALILDLMETPPPFADTYSNLPLTSTAASPYAKFVNGLNPPNNYLTNYTTTGKVNLNTAADENVVNGVEWNYLMPVGATGMWPQLQATRLGTGTPLMFIPTYPGGAGLPTRFVGAFRPASTANIAPQSPPGGGQLRYAGVALPTWLKVGAIPGAMPGLVNPYPGYDIKQPLAGLQRAIRLPNLVTQQSNVFTVRMTLCYFEYDPATGLGTEHVGSSGEVERHKAFYIIDRSVPVGFKPGEDLNTNDTILLRRVLQ